VFCICVCVYVCFLFFFLGWFLWFVVVYIFRVLGGFLFYGFLVVLSKVFLVFFLRIVCVGILFLLWFSLFLCW